MIRRFSTGAMLFLIGGIFGCGHTDAKRLPESGFQVAFESYKIPPNMIADETVSAHVTLKNISPVTWPSKPDTKDRFATNLSYHWLNQKGAVVVFDGLRTPLPQDVKPGESVTLNAIIQAPEKPGKYLLEVTLVQEQSAWFPEKKGAKLALPIIVTAEAAVKTDDSGIPKSTRKPRTPRKRL
jgi:hypothetical protein